MSSELSPSPSLSMSNGIPVVSSLDIAEHFGKRHDDVLKKINNLEIPQEFRLRNFAESSYLNFQNKEQPAYNLTRDGFTLLVMGFTGKAALQWKIRYIEAFNAMEQELINSQPSQPALPASTPADRRPLREAVDRLVRTRYSNTKINNSHFREAWHEVNEYMQTKGIKDIPVDHLQSAVEYVEELIELCGGEPAYTTGHASSIDALDMSAVPASEALSMSAAECVASAKFCLLRATYLTSGDGIRLLYHAYATVDDVSEYLKGEGRYAKGADHE